MTGLPPFGQQITFLRTADLDRSHEFYTLVLGLTFVLDQGDCRIYSLSDTAFIGLCLGRDGEAGEGVIVTFVTDEVDEWCDQIRSQGVALESGPEHNERFGIYHAFLRDPDGNRLEIQRFATARWPSPVRRDRDKTE